MLIDREVVDVDQQLLDKTGNSLGIEYVTKLVRRINFVTFANNHFHEYFGSKILVT